MLSNNLYNPICKAAIDLREAMYYEKLEDGRVRCGLCPHGCVIAPGKRGACDVRENIDGTLYSANYGLLTSISADPVEKKPLRRFLPGTITLSCGSFGCNMQCSHCQNWTISRGRPAARAVAPEEFVRLASEGGYPSVAFTYNEPTIFYEWVLETAKAARKAGIQTILVTNGFISPEPLMELLPYVNAMNIDLKAFTEDGYRQMGGKLGVVQDVIARAAGACHVEVTMLMVPGVIDTVEEIEEAARWLAGVSRDIPLHLTRCFPAYRHTAEPTSVALMHDAAEAARKHLRYVYLGNV